MNITTPQSASRPDAAGTGGHGGPSALRLALVYALLAVTGLLLSDLFIGRYLPAGGTRELWELAKDLTFIVLTTGLVFWLVRRALRAISRVEQHYRELVEGASDIVYTLDREGRFTSINPAVEKILGYTPAELQGQRLSDLSPDFATPCETRLVGEAHRRYELALPARDGRTVHLEINSQTLFQNDQPSGVQGVARDITARKQAEAALRDSEQRFRDLFDNAPLGIYRTTPDGRILAANAALVQMLGYDSLAELSQRNLELEGFDPTYQREVFREQLERDGRIVGLEAEWLRKDRATIYVRENARAIYGPDGSILSYDGVVEDITQRKQAEMALSRERDVLRALLDNTVDTIYFKDTQSRFTLINQAQARVLGLADPQDALGKTDLDFFPTDLAALMWAEERQIIETGQPVLSREELNPTRDGQPRWFSVSKNPLFDHAGRIVGLVGVSRDITAVKLREREFETMSRLNAQLLAAEREQRTFTEALRDMAAALSSTLNVDEVLDQILDSIGRVAPHDAANIMLIDSSSGQPEARVARCHGYDLISLELDQTVRQVRLPVNQLANLRQMVETGQPCIISNIHTYPDWVRTPSTVWQKSYAGAPIRLRDSVVGFIQLDSRQADFFTPVTAERLQTFADQAAVAIENARLFQAEREQHALAEALRDTASALTSTLDVDEVLDRILSNVGRIVPNEVATLLLIEHGVARVMRAVGYHLPARAEYARRLRFVIAQTPNLKRVVETQRPHFISDTTTDPIWTPVAGIDWIKSNIVAPMIVKGQIVGVLALDSGQPNFYAAIHAERLQIFAAQAAVALENAQLFNEAQDRVKELAVLFDSSRAITASLDRATVLQTIAHRLAEAVDATSVYVLSVDLAASVVHVLAEYFSPAANDLERVSDLGATYSLDDLPATLEALRRGQASISVIDDPASEAVAVKQLKTYGGQSSLRVPMNVAGNIRAYAVIWDSRTPRRWTEAEIRLCQTLANQAAVALENVRLLDETRQGLKEQSALLAASTAVSSTLDLQTVLLRLAEQMGRAIDATSVYVCEWNRSANTSTVVVEYYGPAAAETERVSDLHVTYDLSLDYGQEPIWQQAGGSLVSHVDDPDLPPARRLHLQQFGCWSVLTVGLTAKANVFGYIELWESRQRRIFTADEITLCLAIAQQAAIAFENARLFEAERKQLRLAQTLQAVGALLTAQMSLDMVYQKLFELLADVIHYDSVSLHLIVGDHMQLAAGRGFPNMAEAAGVISNLPAPWLSNKWGGAEQRYSVISNTYADPRWTIYPGSEYIRSWIGAVLRVKGNLLGILNVDSTVPGAYTEELGETVAAFANQAAIAIENARLFEAERRQLRLAQTLQAVGALLTAQMSLNEVFDYLFDLLGRVVEYDSVSVQLVEDDRLALTAGRGFPDASVMREVISHVSRATLTERWGASHQRVITVPDTYADPRWIIHPGSEYIRSWIGAALRVKGQLLGILNVDSATPGAYTEELGETVAAFANQAAIAIENAQLNEAVRRHADELEERVIARTAELEHERKRTAAILDTAGEGIIFTDASGTIEYINQALERLTGYESREALGQNPRLWKSGQTSPALYHEMWDTIKRGRIWQGELVNRHKDGRLYDAALTIAPLYNADGQLAGFVGVQRDITQRKELDRLKDEFVSNVSHELRTPIANVKLYISLLTRGKPERHEEYLQTLRRESARLEKLIENLLDLSRLDLDTVKVELQPVDLNQLSAQLIADRAALAASRQHTIDYHTDERMVLALADPAALSQVFTNLLTNAINYTPPTGLITVSVAYREQGGQRWATFTIKDTGPGITSADLPHLFQRFYRGEAGRKSGAPGTGLGLAISDKIVDRLGGQITVDSQPGRGAAFTVWLNTI